MCIQRPGNCRALRWQSLGSLLSPIIGAILRIHTKAFELRLVNTFVSHKCEYMSSFPKHIWNVSRCLICISEVELTRPLSGAPTCEVDVADVLEQQRAVDGVHFRAETNFSRTEVLVHAVQSVSHGVNRVDHELNLPFLFIGRVFPNTFMI